jgi:hypothetical protein
MKKDVVGLIALMRSGRVPLIPPEEAFLSKMDKKDSSEIKLTTRDKKALETFTRRMTLGLSNPADEEFEIGDPRPYPRILIPDPIPYPDREPVPVTPIRKPTFIPKEMPLPVGYSRFRLGKANKEDREIEIEDPRPYPRIVIRPITTPAMPCDPIPVKPQLPVEVPAGFLRGGY